MLKLAIKIHLYYITKSTLKKMKNEKNLKKIKFFITNDPVTLFLLTFFIVKYTLGRTVLDGWQSGRMRRS